MSKTKTSFPDEHRTASNERAIDRFAKKVLNRALGNIHFGRLTLNDESGARTFGNGREISVSVQVTDPRFYSDIAFGGAIGAAEAYMRGYWTTDELTTASVAWGETVAYGNTEVISSELYEHSVVLSPLLEGRSTSGLVERIRNDSPPATT